MLIAVWLLCFPGRSAAGNSAALFSWIDSLGFERDLHKPFVRVEDVGNTGQKDMPPLAYGFLLANRKDSFDVLIPSLSVRTYYKPKGPKGAYEWVRGSSCAFVASNFRAFANDYLRSSGPGEGRFRFMSNDDPWFGYGSTWTIAWICRGKGMAREAKMLADLGRPTLYSGAGKKSGTTASDVKDWIVQGVYGDLILTFEDLQESRLDLLGKFRSFANRFHGTKPVKGAAAVTHLLQSMVREDQLHRASKDHVSELIWRLRDDGRPYNPYKKTAVDQLVEIGFPAVPQLLDALRDRRFTRTVFHPYSGPAWQCPEDGVFRVGDLAEQALERIAHRQFTDMRRHSLVAAEKSARAWWTSIKANGELSSLVEAVRLGDSKSSDQADRLVEAYPTAAFDAIRAGVGNAKDPQTRAGLILALQDLRDKEVEPFVRQIAAKDKEPEPRFSAAKVLANIDPDAAIGIAERELDRLKGPETLETQTELIPFLMQSRSPAAIRWVAGRMKSWTTETRGQAIGNFYNGIEGPFAFQFASDPKRQRVLSEDKKKELSTAVEDLLAMELNDRELTSSEIGVRDVSLGPEMSDLAEYALAQCFPDRYKFAQPASKLERERLRLSNLNTYRKSRGLGPEPPTASAR